MHSSLRVCCATRGRLRTASDSGLGVTLIMMIKVIGDFRGLYCQARMTPVPTRVQTNYRYQASRQTARTNETAIRNESSAERASHFANGKQVVSKYNYESSRKITEESCVKSESSKTS